MGTKFTIRVIELWADLAIFADQKLGEFAQWVFSKLPKKIQRTLHRLNSSFVAHRNRYLGISESGVDRIESEVPSVERESNELVSSNKELSLSKVNDDLALQRGDVPGWVLVVLMTTGLVTALWTIAAPRLSQILRNSLDSMNSIR